MIKVSITQLNGTIFTTEDVSCLCGIEFNTFFQVSRILFTFFKNEIGSGREFERKEMHEVKTNWDLIVYPSKKLRLIVSGTKNETDHIVCGLVQLFKLYDVIFHCKIYSQVAECMYFEKRRIPETIEQIETLFLLNSKGDKLESKVDMSSFTFNVRNNKIRLFKSGSLKLFGFLEKENNKEEMDIFLKKISESLPIKKIVSYAIYYHVLWLVSKNILNAYDINQHNIHWETIYIHQTVFGTKK